MDDEWPPLDGGAAQLRLYGEPELEALPVSFDMLQIADEIPIAAPPLDDANNQTLHRHQIAWRRLIWLLRQAGVDVADFTLPGELSEWVRVVGHLIGSEELIDGPIFGVVINDRVDRLFVVQRDRPPPPGEAPQVTIDLASVARRLRADLWRIERRNAQEDGDNAFELLDDPDYERLPPPGAPRP